MGRIKQFERKYTAKKPHYAEKSIVVTNDTRIAFKNYEIESLNIDSDNLSTFFFKIQTKSVKFDLSTDNSSLNRSENFVLFHKLDNVVKTSHGVLD